MAVTCLSWPLALLASTAFYGCLLLLRVVAREDSIVKQVTVVLNFATQN